MLSRPGSAAWPLIASQLSMLFFGSAQYAVTAASAAALRESSRRIWPTMRAWRFSASVFFVGLGLATRGCALGVSALTAARIVLRPGFVSNAWSRAAISSSIEVMLLLVLVIGGRGRGPRATALLIRRDG